MKPSAEQVRAQLERLLASSGLASSSRLQRFLRYVVERTLQGERDRLKEYAVGVEVFDRGEQYDPRVDSIVRVEAGRLRAKLAEYYDGPGAGDQVIIRVPRGSYVPEFQHRLTAPADPQLPGPGPTPVKRDRHGWRPALVLLSSAILALVIVAWPFRARPAVEPPPASVTVAVLPFAHYSSDAADELLAARIADGVRGELVRAPGIDVVSRLSSLQFADAPQSLGSVARALNVDLVVEASVITDSDRVRVQARLVDPAVDRKVSVHEFEGRRPDLDRLQRLVADAIAAAARVPAAGRSSGSDPDFLSSSARWRSARSLTV